MTRSLGRDRPRHGPTVVAVQWRALRPAWEPSTSAEHPHARCTLRQTSITCQQPSDFRPRLWLRVKSPSSRSVGDRVVAGEKVSAGTAAGARSGGGDSDGLVVPRRRRTTARRRAAPRPRPSAAARGKYVQERHEQMAQSLPAASGQQCNRLGANSPPTRPLLRARAVAHRETPICRQGRCPSRQPLSTVSSNAKRTAPCGAERRVCSVPRRPLLVFGPQASTPRSRSLSVNSVARGDSGP